MGESDYQTGYRGGQYHHGMDRSEYTRGKDQKDLENTLGGGGQKTEVSGVAFTLLLIAPMIWMVYPVLGFTLLAIFAACVGLFGMVLHWQVAGFIIGTILCVASFFWGMKLEYKVSQFTAYRWIRGILRIVLAFMFTVVFASGKDMHDRFMLSQAQPGAIVLGFFVAVMVYLIMQRLDLLYFPARAEIKKMKEQIARGERPKRPILKRLFFGFCWFIPAMMILNLIVNIVVRLMMEEPSQRQTFYGQYNVLITSINAGIWYVLCLLGILPGTGKYMLTKEQVEALAVNAEERRNS